jgi:hypothetical protein
MADVKNPSCDISEKNKEVLAAYNMEPGTLVLVVMVYS